jgi:hypothetical protein
MLEAVCERYGNQSVSVKIRIDEPQACTYYFWDNISDCSCSRDIEHLEIMGSLEPLENAIVLIVGGYVLQGLLLISNRVAFRNRKHLKTKI